MRLPAQILLWLKNRAMRCAKREPNFIVGDASRPYLRRWYVIPRNPVFNIYLHQFLRSDDDRALHDHPWVNASILLEGEYVEHTIPQGGINRRVRYVAGDVKFRGPRYAHRVELSAGECWTLFITGPRLRVWGFHCPHGWKPWQEFTKAGAPGEIGPGCEEPQTKPIRDRFDGASADDLERDRREFLENTPLAHKKSTSEHSGSSA